jgi:hypothetical protein
MKVEISFVVGPGSTPDHRTDQRFSKVFDVEWPGRPMPGEDFEVDVGPPIQETQFQVKGIHWTTESPVNVYLERIEVEPDEVEWDGGLDGYVAYCRTRGWKVNGR